MHHGPAHGTSVIVLRFHRRSVLASFAACCACASPEPADHAEQACGLHGCVDVDEAADPPKADGSTVREEVGAGLIVIGHSEASAELLGDLATLEATSVGAEVLARVHERAEALGGRVKLRPRPDPQGGETTCANTVFAAGGFDLERAHAAETQTDATGREAVLEPGDPVEPGSIRVLYNRLCIVLDEAGEPCAAPPHAFLMHELLHALHAMEGTLLHEIRDPSDPIPGGSNHEEAATIGRGAYVEDVLTENALRRELGLPQRDTHQTLCGVR